MTEGKTDKQIFDELENDPSYWWGMRMARDLILFQLPPAQLRSLIGTNLNLRNFVKLCLYRGTLTIKDVEFFYEYCGVDAPWTSDNNLDCWDKYKKRYRQRKLLSDADCWDGYKEQCHQKEKENNRND